MTRNQHGQHSHHAHGSRHDDDDHHQGDHHYDHGHRHEDDHHQKGDHHYDHGHRHDDDHHQKSKILDTTELTRRRALYLVAAGIVSAAAGFAPGATAATPKKKKRITSVRRPTISTAAPTTTATAVTAVTAATAATATAARARAGTDPWSLFPATVRASRTATEVVIESTGLPEHQMMVGITSWQQQVPLPQPFSGANAWRLPQKGVLSETPISGRTALFRGAIALAVNGVPIFNALNNRGEDAFLYGELDQWGGHCGRADDYHYHVAPLHLQNVTGPAVPIAFGLDGYPMFGLTEPDGSPVRTLDEYNGHADPVDGYHYHASLSFPYANGGMRGKVTVRDDGIDPQPMTPPVRPAGAPLRAATITGFSTTGLASKLEYRLGGALYRVEYTIDGASVRFVHTDPSGATRTETFQRRA